VFKRFSVGFAAGYVFGAKAGQKRYDQITDLADRVVNMPGVSRLTDRASEVFTADHGRVLLNNVMDRARSMGSGNGSSEDSDDEDFEDSDEDDVEDSDDEDFEDSEDDSDEESEEEPEEDEGGDDFEASDDIDEEEDEDGAEVDDIDDRGGGEEDESEDEQGSEDEQEDGSRPQGGRIRSLASAALERGRVG